MNQLMKHYHCYTPVIKRSRDFQVIFNIVDPNDGLVQERRNSNVLAMELLLSYINPSIT